MFDVSPSVTRRTEQGIALVITLILLSVTLVMAVAFLAIANRERNAVTTTTDTATARHGAETALAYAEAQIVANILSSTNAAAYNFSLLVSTNYINGLGFTTGSGNPTNVNYDFLINNGGTLTTANQRNQNIANLWFLPRAPVFITTNRVTGGADFRYYLDLNRNGRFETNGFTSDFDSANPPNVLGSSFKVGDPEWIGILERPDAPHGPDNKFVARVAFVAQPIGNSLDLNAIHNDAYNISHNQNQNMNSGPDGFFRNQGVGSWELNLAAFLADLNTNEWNSVLQGGVYNYLTPGGFNNNGAAFYDALSLLSYRYGYNYGSLTRANNYFANFANYPFNIDGYSDGPLQTTLNTNASFFGDNLNLRWSGSDNTNRFFALTSDLFDPNKTAVAFTNHLTLASSGNGAANPSTYDRYTFYRMLDQLGTDSTADSGKMNLNYDNLSQTNFVSGSVSETNFFRWQPLAFFTNAADRMLRTYTANWFASNPTNYLVTYYGYTPVNYVAPNGYGLTNFPYSGMINQAPAFGIGNIPVFVYGQFVYSPAVNRVLQLAANIYDASTNSFYPSVFRPTFWVTNQYGYKNVYINGYEQVTLVTPPSGTTAFPPLDQPVEVTGMPFGQTVGLNVRGGNVYGVPWIIGAKKGFPNFNKFGMESIIQITRKMQVGRNLADTTKPTHCTFTNQLYAFNINNTIGVECWNSYSNTYPNTVQINVQDFLSMSLTNDYGLPASAFSGYSLATNWTVISWPGYPNASSFQVPIQRTAYLLTNSDLYFGTTPPGLSGFYAEIFNKGWESNRFTFDLPHFGLLTTNRFQLSMLDFSNGLYHVIDYVHFAGPDTKRDLNAAFQTGNTTSTYDNMWSTNMSGLGLPYGVLNQWDASRGAITLNSLYWKDPTTLKPVSARTAMDEIIGFCTFLGISPPIGSTVTSTNVVQFYASNSVVQLPYTPVTFIYDYTGWQANDPLVHYLASDLTYNGAEQGGNLLSGINKLADNVINAPTPSYNSLNDRYQPWGKAAPIAFQTSGSSGYNFLNPYNLIYKDPLVWSSDYWDFPTNQYPTVGWIGRVHRGTPWQTVYLKAQNVLHALNSPADINTWTAWTGDYYNAFDAANSAPLQDRMLFDLFTTSFNDNAARGTLSVNVGAGNPSPSAGLAAWSALFSGMVALTNTTHMPSFNTPNMNYIATNNWMVIQPAGVNGNYSSLGYLVTNINNSRSVFTNADGVVGVFEHKGDILSVAALTELSPFLNWNNVNQLQKGISDEVYEWLPQQMMSLLRCPTGPHYVIYCYGQTLKPAQGGLVTSSSNFKLVTNYQVVAESAVRAVIRVDKHVTATGTNYSTVVESYNPLPPN